MLNKLIKYDLISLFKKFVPIWSLIIIMSILNGVLIKYEKYTSNHFYAYDLPRIAFGAIIAVAIVIAIFYVCSEFYDGLLGKRGYFMLSIPTRTESLILLKNITALILECISLLVAIITGIIIIYAFAPDFIKELFYDMFSVYTSGVNGIKLTILTIEFILFIITLMFTINFHIYTSISIGHLFMKHRKMFSVISFIVLSIVFYYIAIYIISPIEKTIYFTFPEVKTISSGIALTIREMGVIIIACLILDCTMFFIIRYILNNKLNLE